MPSANRLLNKGFHSPWPLNNYTQTMIMAFALVKRKNMKTLKFTSMALMVAALSFPACKSMNKTQKGAIIGTAAGGATGAVIGRVAGNTALGAVIGAAVGGVTGALIGKKMDKQAEDIAKQIPGVSVTRVGEAIVVEFSNDILFGFDSYKISQAAGDNLKKLVNILGSYPDTDIAIVGHTDNSGTATYNKTLSLRRADAVAANLINQKIMSTRITTLG